MLFKSISVKCFAPIKHCTKSSILNHENQYLMILLLMMHESMHIHYSPPSVGANVIVMYTVSSSFLSILNPITRELAYWSLHFQQGSINVVLCLVELKLHKINLLGNAPSKGKSFPFSSKLKLLSKMEKKHLALFSSFKNSLVVHNIIALPLL